MKSATDFSKEVLNATKEYGFIKSISSEIQDGIIFRCRMYIEQDLFIDVFYNSITSKTAYTLVHKDRRIFGADNTGKWHYHPFDNPSQHIPCKEFKINDFLVEVEKFVVNNMDTHSL